MTNDMEQDFLENNQDTDQDFDTAFSEAADSFSDGDEDFSDVDDEDTDVEDTDGPDDNDSGEDEDEVSEEESVDDADQDDDIDWRSAYERTATHNQQLQRRFDELESQYKSWKGRVEAEESRKQPTKAEVESLEAATDTELKDFMDLYPEFAAPVQKLIDARVAERVAETQKHIDELIDKNVKPLQKRVQESEAQAHVAAIKNAHPDVGKYLSDGSLEQWIDTLPPYQRRGAQYVAVHGSTDEVIQLLSDFKSSKGVRKNSNLEEQTPNQKENKSSKDVTAKLKDALYVKSSTTAEPETSKEPSDPKKLFDLYSKQVMQEG